MHTEYINRYKLGSTAAEKELVHWQWDLKTEHQEAKTLFSRAAKKGQWARQVEYREAFKVTRSSEKEVQEHSSDCSERQQEIAEIPSVV